MKVIIKQFRDKIAIRNKGIEIQINDTNNKQLGDLVITATKLIWCKGRTTPENGVEINWKEFIEYAEKQK